VIHELDLLEVESKVAQKHERERDEMRRKAEARHG
jgi:hypothetical protein